MYERYLLIYIINRCTIGMHIMTNGFEHFDRPGRNTQADMHSRHYNLILTLALITSLTIFSGCKRNILSESGQQDKNEVSPNADALLISQIETFSIDVGENGQRVWKDLMAYPRN